MRASTWNLFAGINEETEEDIDDYGLYTSFEADDLTLAVGYTRSERADYDTIVDAAIAWESDLISLAAGYQDVDTSDDPVLSVALTLTYGAVAFTPYYEEHGENNVAAFNLTYEPTDSFRIFLETANYSSGTEADNIELGLAVKLD